ncbi:MAG: hypothetical protein KKB30_03245 [Proteobacteria bacterium]|nr:hypothetical protein [Pseudomonadota bacterium]MBU1714726.1 hypothetical protein [Pseudomonadota bacterium]
MLTIRTLAIPTPSIRTNICNKNTYKMKKRRNLSPLLSGVRLVLPRGGASLKRVNILTKAKESHISDDLNIIINWKKIGVTMSEKVRWVLLGGYGVACIISWQYFPTLIQEIGRMMAEVFVENPNMFTKYTLFCVAIAFLMHVAKNIIYFVLYHREYEDKVNFLTSQKGLLTSFRRKNLINFGAVVFLSATIVLSIGHKKFNPSTTMFDFIVIALTIYIVVEGITDFLKFIPFFQTTNHRE